MSENKLFIYSLINIECLKRKEKMTLLDFSWHKKLELICFLKEDILVN